MIFLLCLKEKRLLTKNKFIIYIKRIEYKNGNLCLGQFAKALNISKKKAMHLLSTLNINIIYYDFKDDLKFLKKL